MLKEARFRALKILWRTQISLSCSSKRWRFFQLISALLKASRKEKWLYPTCAIRKGEKDGEKVNVTSSTLSKDSAVHKRFSEIYWSSQNLHWWCSWKNGLVQLLQSQEEEKENQTNIWYFLLLFLLTKMPSEMDVAPEAISGWTNWVESPGDVSEVKRTLRC